MSLPLATCIHVQDSNGLVLACSRRDDHTAFGMPGGKVDPGETRKQAAVRELLEETGYKVDPDSLVLVYNDICEGDVDYQCACYQVPYSAVQQVANVDPAEGVVSWVLPEVLFRGPFAGYNKSVYSEIERREREVSMGLAPGLCDTDDVDVVWQSPGYRLLADLTLQEAAGVTKEAEDFWLETGTFPPKSGQRWRTLYSKEG